MDEATSHSPPTEKKGELLTIIGDTEVGEPCIFSKGCVFVRLLFFVLC